MKIGKINLYPLSLLVSLVILYLIATDTHGWYIYVLMAFVILERAFLQLAMKLLASVQRKLVEQITSNLSAVVNQTGGIQPFDQEIE